jgi:cell division septation protein DedD
VMEEQATWKGHTFTLLVFTGIVVLSSIFFILGMLAGRMQGQKTATVLAGVAPEKEDTKVIPDEIKPAVSVYESVRKAEPTPLNRPPAPPPAKTPVSGGLNYQVGAVRNAADAEKLLEAVKKKGFRGFILAPAPGDSNPFYRVQVGPVADSEAQEIKKKLEAAGYKPIPRK